MSTIQLLVLAKSDIYLDGLLLILRDDVNIKVTHCDAGVTDALQQIDKQHFDVILMQDRYISPPVDLFFNQFILQQVNAQQVKAQVTETTPTAGLKILVFGQQMDNDFLLNIIRSGASGYINSNMSAKHLLQAVHYAHNGNMWAEHHILEQLARDALQMENVLEDIAMEKTRMISDLLTRREAQVFQWILKGLTTKEIAEQIHLSEQSVKLHLGKLFKKFDVSNRAQLILSAFERVSPVNNIIPLIQATLEKKNLSSKK